MSEKGTRIYECSKCKLTLIHCNPPTPFEFGCSVAGVDQTLAMSGVAYTNYHIFLEKELEGNERHGKENGI